MAIRPTPVFEESLTSSDAAIGASATRKAAQHLIPLIALGYGTAYMDRVNISFAALQMNRDLHFSATTYGFGAGLFFLSYAACEVPSNLLLYRFGARRWLARIMITWGLLAIGMLFVRTPAQFYIVRFLLGMSEAGFFPGVVFYLMQWFPPELRARTVSRFYISLPLSAAFMGLIAGALLNLDGQLGLRGWQWLFLVEGMPAVLLGIAFYFLLPDTPAHAKWLNEDERQWIFHNVHQNHIDQHPVRHDASGSARPHESIRHVLLSPRVLQLGIFEVLMLMSIYGYVFIAPEFIRSITHFSITKVGYTICALSLIGVPSMLLGAMLSDHAHSRSQNRYRLIIPCCVVMAIALAVCGLSTSLLLVLSALVLLQISYYAMQGPFWALPASLFTGRCGAACIAAVNTLGITGGFIGPYWMGVARDITGNHQRGLLTLSVPMLAATGIMLYLHRQAPDREGIAPVPSLHEPRGHE
jgi:ACS family tartrate transporter-like MFS transporter